METHLFLLVLITIIVLGGVGLYLIKKVRDASLPPHKRLWWARALTVDAAIISGLWLSVCLAVGWRVVPLGVILGFGYLLAGLRNLQRVHNELKAAV